MSRIFLFLLIFIAIVILYYKSILTFLAFSIPQSAYSSPLEFANYIRSINPFYQERYANSKDWQTIPYLYKEDLIEHNKEIVQPGYHQCKITCSPSCFQDPVFRDPSCLYGQSTGGTSGKSTFIWMSRWDAYRYIRTFIQSFRKNGYSYGDQIMVFYPSNSYFTNEYESSNQLLISTVNVFFSTFKQVELDDARRFVEHLNTNKPDLLVIFPFVFLKLCTLIKRNNLNLRHMPKNINLSGEYLLTCTKNYCKSVFTKSNIENTYGAVEFGEIAHEVPGVKNTYEVFSNICYLENKDDKIVVTSYINTSFPILRYVMEDIGTIVNKDGKQYIVDLVGKATNQIKIGSSKFTSLQVDSLIEKVNTEKQISSVVIRYDDSKINVNYIIDSVPNDKDLISMQTKEILKRIFPKIDVRVYFIDDYKHDYLRKFKIIERSDKRDAEPVGGYYKV